jgi:translin
MSTNSLQQSLRIINAELKEAEERREKLLKGTRDVVSLCSKSIVDLHHGKQDEAKEKLRKANMMLAEFRGYTKDDLQKYLLVPEQEFVEASVLISVVEDSEIPGSLDLKVSGPAYTIGLLDCIGECKRRVYDKVRKGSLAEAQNLFNFMEEIYGLVYPFAIYDNLVGGLKRKLDVAKSLIEDVRSLITEESRRQNLMRAIEHLENRFRMTEQ